MRYIVTGGAGFIGSHLVDSLINLNHDVIILDNLLSGTENNINKKAIFINCDIRKLDNIKEYFKNIDGVFHLAAIARTPWCVDDPILAYETNVIGTLNVLEASKQNNIKRVVMTSSNVIYAFWTPYRSSKEALESLATVYNNMYNLSVICLRNSNVYGSRQSELGPSPNVFSALRKSKRENNFIEITGDGTQSRDFTHVSDIVEGHICAMNSNIKGVFDLCTGINHSLNDIAKYFNCDIKYKEERPGDIKHIYQDSLPAFENLNWKAKITLKEGMKDFFSDISFQTTNDNIFVILVSYRARGLQTFRRNQLIKLIDNIKFYFNKNKIEYKIIISEQNNDNQFNRGLLLNVAFLESEKLFNFPKKYFHMNADYTIDISRKFPNELLGLIDGFIDLYRPPCPVLGAACVFDSESYKKINGFPNDLYGWGGDDWAIYNRIVQKKINILTPTNLFNSNFIINEDFKFNLDQSNNNKNMNLAKRNDSNTNGLTSINYTLDGYGEFHDGNIIFNYLINF
jgi:UDP-glucose 4-epimerase